MNFKIKALGALLTLSIWGCTAQEEKKENGGSLMPFAALSHLWPFDRRLSYHGAITLEGERTLRLDIHSLYTSHFSFAWIEGH